MEVVVGGFSREEAMAWGCYEGVAGVGEDASGKSAYSDSYFVG